MLPGDRRLDDLFAYCAGIYVMTLLLERDSIPFRRK